MKKFILLGISATFLFATQFITIGTGGVTGTYYPTGGTICKFVNKIKEKTNIRCSIESTGGSVYNINAIKSGELDFAIVQSDIVYQASKGIGEFKGEKFPKLRSILAIYPESFTLVTRRDANINGIMDIKGKRINIGNVGSGNEATALALFKALNIKTSDLSYVGNLKSSAMPDALRDNKLDGYFYMVGHPTANIKDASNSTDTKIVPIIGAKVDKFVKEHPYFTKTDIPGGIYRGNPKEIPTFAVKAVLVANSTMSDKAVYTVVKQIMENFNEFKKAHLALTPITKKSFLEGLSAPLHTGAKKYFKEIGLIK
ncbi:TAXI family TRAP transporter solute-binding subunit [Arcobacter sp.]|uniref:TAXI family TRAP transporter solute-binding subunit n=1 Tax=unclassified Arcobacter TaxID=2593671 RepID=UPI003AFF753D|eukprot:TRINITY_DN1820_c0_g2_i1.p1 TRINITY_DN1820_c0_g2~~TRINITY_DN1820_c0_g2_i1.p1  ORF type:complete len:313 (-),score=-51.46 TRINITY_DN1820_c0_g2_i1:625-1563(-)